MLIAAPEALARLQEGNRRFVLDRRDGELDSLRTRRLELAQGQAPFAVVLGCSDSRVPVEFVFDQGLGDLFVVRVAGNVVAPSLLGSIQFSVERFGTRLVVVLGHTGCGAVRATYEALTAPGTELSPNLAAIVERVRPALAPLLPGELPEDPTELLRAGVRANVRHSVAKVRRELLGHAEHDPSGEIWVVGAEYCLEEGVVRFLEDPGGTP